MHKLNNNLKNIIFLNIINKNFIFSILGQSIFFIKLLDKKKVHKLVTIKIIINM